MSPAKKPPRPVTRWFIDYGDGTLGCDGSPKKRFQRDIRCRVTPIRPATEIEIQKLTKALGKASGLHEMDQVRLRSYIRAIACAAWRRGAR